MCLTKMNPDFIVGFSYMGIEKEYPIQSCALYLSTIFPVNKPGLIVPLNREQSYSRKEPTEQAT